MFSESKLKELMNIKGIKTLMELSKGSNLAYTTLHYIKNGHDSNISTATVLADYLKEPVDNLITRNSYYVLYFSVNNKVMCKKINASSIYEVTTRYMM